MSSYGKVDENDQARLEARRKTRKRITIIAVSSVVLACTVIGIFIAGTTAHGGEKSPENNAGSISASVKALCNVTLYQERCFQSLSSAANSSSLSPEELFTLAVKITVKELSEALKRFSDENSAGKGGNSMETEAMGACTELLGLAVEYLNETAASSSSHNDLTLPELVDDLRTWLSSVETYQETCVEALEEATNEENPNLKMYGETHLKNSTESASNALAIITWLGKIANSMNLKRRLLTTKADSEDEEMAFPGRRLLQSTTDLRKIANIVVAKDGSGKYKTISRALEDVPEKSTRRTIIYVKKGTYVENVRVEKNKWNVVMVGDGQGRTVVSFGLNFVDGTPTFKTATFAVFGKGFMARDMSFRNTAGPSKHQAVALMVSADLAAFYRCTMDAYQDTLYVHAQRQFYRECTVLGTVDFIFGNSAVVLQNCFILPRRPMDGQKNTITAQGRTDPNQNTGISIHNCKISPFGNLSGVQTFLGRPWKDFSTSVYLESFMNEFIDPKGWLPWTGDSAPSTIFYGEYKNFGGGASTRKRVKWKGLRFIGTKEANKFSVKTFVQGPKWLPASGVPFKSAV